MDNVKKSNHRPFLRFIALLLCVLMPLPIVICSVFFAPNIYGDTFLGALAPKLERLQNTDGNRIIVVGGSSVAFGLDSKLLAEHTGYEVVNFGLYATLGTKAMLDLSRAHIRQGDIVVVAPELDPQTLSMYFGGEAVWQAANSDPSILLGIAPENSLDLAAAYPTYIFAVLSRTLTGEGSISPEGIYRRDSFNEYGDISYPREYNIMTAGYDVNKKVSLSPEIFDEKFIDYLNAYVSELALRGAKVCFSFCPVNRSSLEDGTDTADAEELYRFVSKKLYCPVISDPSRLLMHEGYFYDTNFHLNDAGVTVRTLYLAEDIRRLLGITERLEYELPQIPSRPAGETPSDWIENEWSELFLYEPFADGLRIVGVTDAAKGYDSLTLPYMADGRRVLVLGEGALEGCSALTELTVNANISLMENGAFSGAPDLKKVNMLCEDADAIETGAELFTGANSDLRLYFYTDESYESFISGYWWGVHSGRMVNATEQ